MTMKHEFSNAQKTKHLQAKIEGLRTKMYNTSFIHGCPLDSKTIRASKNLDKAINEYMKIKQ